MSVVGFDVKAERVEQLRAGRDETGEGASARLGAIERTSRQTLEEMRSLVGVLRHRDVDESRAPQPTLTHLEALVVRAKGAGARIKVDGSPRALPAEVELSAYRIVEQLLAALDDAPDVEVQVSFASEVLELKVAGRARRRAYWPRAGRRVSPLWLSSARWAWWRAGRRRSFSATAGAWGGSATC